MPLESPPITPSMELRRALDPQGTLPAVELVPPENYGLRKGIQTDLFTITHDGQRVGEAQLQRDGRNKEHNFSHIRLDEGYEGRGLGTSTYLAAVERAHSEGHTFRTHEISQTKVAKNVWDKFIESGVASVVVVKPFVLGDEGKYDGHVRIEPPHQKEA